MGVTVLDGAVLTYVFHLKSIIYIDNNNSERAQLTHFFANFQFINVSVYINILLNDFQNVVKNVCRKNIFELELKFQVPIYLN